jgi:ABC-type Fe3+ transport system substrate-binding protein
VGPKTVSTIALCLLVVAFGVSSTGYSQSIDSALLSAGKKDGALVWYSMESTHIVEALRKKFEEQVPPIRLKTFRSRSSEIANRISAEAKTERHEFDVATVNPITAYALKSRGLIKPHTPKEAQKLLSAFRDPDGYWNSAIFSANVIGYNTKLIPVPPKAIDEFISPKWKGKVGLDTEEYEWLACELKLRGEKEGLAFLRKLSEFVVMRKGHTLGTQLTAAGEFSAFIHGNAAEFHQLKINGAPVDMALTAPTQATPRATALSAKSRREAAAKVFMEWLFSRETAKFITQIGRTSTRSDIERHPAALSSKQDFFVLADAEYFENYGKYVKLFDEIFMRRS